jgi:hypothetical protein
VVLAGLGPAGALAQLTPVTPPVPIVVPVPPTVVDTLKKLPVGLAPDTTRVSFAVAPQPPDKVTRPLAIRITAAIVLITLTTLLLYNVRSR